MDVQESSCQIQDTTLTIRLGDLVKTVADVLVSSDDSRLSMTGGVAKALLAAGGPQIKLDAQKHVPSSIGEVVVTTAGSLPAKYIFHTPTIDYVNMQFAGEADIRGVTTRCLQTADTLAARSIAFPVLGAGMGGFPLLDAVRIMVQAMADYLEGGSRLAEVSLVLHEKVVVPGAGPEGVQHLYGEVVALATEISQRYRVAALLTELNTLLAVSGLPDELARIRQEVAAVEDALAALRGHVAKLVQLDVERKSVSGAGVQSEAQPPTLAEGIEYETLRRELGNRLNEDELQTVASDLFGYANDVLKTGTRTQQLLSLLAHLYNRQMIGELLKWLERNRPDVAKDLPPFSPPI